MKISKKKYTESQQLGSDREYEPHEISTDFPSLVRSSL